MIEFPAENYIELENNPYLLGRITLHLVKESYHCEVDIIHKESHKIYLHVAILYHLSSREEALNSGVQKLRNYLIALEKKRGEKDD